MDEKGWRTLSQAADAYERWRNLTEPGWQERRWREAMAEKRADAYHPEGGGQRERGGPQSGPRPDGGSS